jgi:hypothetical protein
MPQLLFNMSGKVGSFGGGDLWSISRDSVHKNGGGSGD